MKKNSKKNRVVEITTTKAQRDEIKKKIDDILAIHERLAHCYFWSGDNGNASKRSWWAEQNSMAINFEWHGQKFEAIAESSQSRKNTYHHFYVYVDDERKDARALKKVLKQIGKEDAAARKNPKMFYGEYWPDYVEKFKKEFPDQRKRKADHEALYDFDELQIFIEKMESLTTATFRCHGLGDFLMAPVFLAPTKDTVHLVHVIATQGFESDKLANVCQFLRETNDKNATDFRKWLMRAPGEISDALVSIIGGKDYETPLPYMWIRIAPHMPVYKNPNKCREIIDAAEKCAKDREFAIQLIDMNPKAAAEWIISKAA